MRRTAYLILGILVIGAIALILKTSQQLPEQVATNFTGNEGLASMRRLSRSYYQLMILGMILMTPLSLSYLCVVLRRFPNRVNIPHRDYWFSPEQRQATLLFLDIHFCWLSCLVVGFITIVHWLIFQANLASPVRLETRYWLAEFVVFFGLGGLWAFQLFKRFRHIP
jgi:hypothetical protein